MVHVALFKRAGQATVFEINVRMLVHVDLLRSRLQADEISTMADAAESEEEKGHHIVCVILFVECSR